MTENNKISLWGRFLATPNNSPKKIVTVAVGVCLVCSILVSSAAVMLKPIQQRNETLNRQKEILKVAGLYQQGMDIEAGFQQIETRHIDLDSGAYVPEQKLSQQTSVAIPLQQDIAGIRERLRYPPVYLVHGDRALDTVILPLQGKGLWSTMHGFVALSADGNTVKSVTFYEHAETPGLGGEISNPKWLAKWEGKRVTGEQGDVALRVIKGSVNPASTNAEHEIDGLSGATLTANGVTRTIHFWLGERGFGPYLAQLRQSTDGEITDGR
jgi:Na+-transporting NADH:ubiquinone oxidoreductase subunit C